jgi:hypothetical protein
MRGDLGGWLLSGEVSLWVSDPWGQSPFRGRRATSPSPLVYCHRQGKALWLLDLSQRPGISLGRGAAPYPREKAPTRTERTRASFTSRAAGIERETWRSSLRASNLAGERFSFANGGRQPSDAEIRERRPGNRVEIAVIRVENAVTIEERRGPVATRRQFPPPRSKISGSPMSRK